MYGSPAILLALDKVDNAVKHSERLRKRVPELLDVKEAGHILL